MSPPMGLLLCHPQRGYYYLAQTGLLLCRPNGAIMIPPLTGLLPYRPQPHRGIHDILQQFYHIRSKKILF